MNILHVCHQYSPAKGGAEFYCRSISEEMTRRGHKVDVYTSRSVDFNSWRNELGPRDVINGVRVFRHTTLPRTTLTWRLLRVGTQRYWRTRSPLWQVLTWYGNGPVMPALTVSVSRNVRRYDIVHIVHLHYAHSWSAMWAARRSNVPVIVSPLLHQEEPATYDFMYLKATMTRAAALLALTYKERSFIKTLLERPPEIVVGALGLPVLTDHSTVDREDARRLLGLPSSSYIILFLARQAPHKGLDLLLAAFPRVREKLPDSVLVVAGAETPYSNRLWRQTVTDGAVVREGEVSEGRKWLLLQACDVMVLPSESESFGIVFLEAWACKKPVIGVNIAAPSSVIDDDVNGKLVEPRSVDELARAILELGLDPDLARRLGRNGHEKLQRRYTLEKAGDVVEACYIAARRRAR